MHDCVRALCYEVRCIWGNGFKEKTKTYVCIMYCSSAGAEREQAKKKKKKTRVENNNMFYKICTNTYPACA